MEEKKLTEEEIIKELINESNRGEWCELSFIDCVEVRVLKNAIDLIHRLQAENAEQNAEIERLTELQSRGGYRVAELSIENAELQKQVDELKEKSKEVNDLVKEKVKDTAKEILQEFARIYTHDTNCTDWREDSYFGAEFNLLCERYGVEVE